MGPQVPLGWDSHLKTVAFPLSFQLFRGPHEGTPSWAEEALAYVKEGNDLMWLGLETPLLLSGKVYTSPSTQNRESSTRVCVEDGRNVLLQLASVPSHVLLQFNG